MYMLGGESRSRQKRALKLKFVQAGKKNVPHWKGAKKDIRIEDLSDDEITCTAKSDKERYKYASKELLSPASSDDESRPVYPNLMRVVPMAWFS